VPDRDGDLDGSDLHPAHLDGAGRHVAVRDIGHDVLVGADAARQNLRDIGVGDHREAEVDGARGGGVLLVVHLTQSQNKGHDSPLVVEQNLASLLEAAGP
jgi:hypothetical protein